MGDSIQYTVTTSNMFLSSISSSFSYSINNFLSPPTNQQVDLISATSYSSDGYQIDRCDFYVSDLTPKALTTISVSNNSVGGLVVNQFYTIRFTFVLTDTISQTDTITVVFPSGSVVNFVSSTVSANWTNSIASTSFQPSSLTLYVTVTNLNRRFNRGDTLILTVGNYQAPPSIQPTSNFVLTIYKNGYKKLEGTTTLTASASTVTGSASMNVSVVNTITSYTFVVTTIDALSSSGKIKIVLPSVLTISTSSTSCAVVAGTNTSISPVCAFNLVQNSITLTSLNASSSNIGAQTLTITIAGIKNANSIKPTPAFTISTYYRSTDASLVASGAIAGVTATTASIPSSRVAATASSYTVNDIGVTYYL